MSTYISIEGAEELKKKIAHLKGPVKEDINQRLIEARSHGDLSENSEYSSAKEAQSTLLTEIENLEVQLKNCIIYKKNPKSSVVTLGSIVVVYDEFDGKITYEISGALESNLEKNIISNESPLGKALLGKKKGDIAEVITPNGKYTVKVLDVK